MPRKPKQIFKEFYLTLALLCALLLFLNFNFFAQQVKYYFGSHKIPTQSQAMQATGQPNFLKIPSLDISVPVQYVSDQTDAAFQAALINGVVHYPGTADPGQPGNPYIFGHSSDYIWSKGHYKTIFAVLPKIQIGAEIIITDQQGNLFNYTVTKTFVTSPNNLSVLDQHGYTDKMLTLQTSYPVGTALGRFIVQAEIAK